MFTDPLLWFYIVLLCLAVSKGCFKARI